MDYQGSIMRSVLAQALHKETRLSERQVMLLEWRQIGDHKITTRQGREAKISNSTYLALKQLPVHGRFVFSTSPFEPILEPPKKRKRLKLIFD